MAAKRGNVKLFLFLLENNVDINPTDKYGSTPLNHAENKLIFEYLK